MDLASVLAGLALGAVVFRGGGPKKEDIKIGWAGFTEYTQTDGRGSLVETNLDPHQGLVRFTNPSNLVVKVMVVIDSIYVGEDRVIRLNNPNDPRWLGRLLGPGEKRIHKIPATWPFGRHDVRVYFFYQISDSLVQKMDEEGEPIVLHDTFYVSPERRSAPEGTGMYWWLDITTTGAW